MAAKDARLMGMQSSCGADEPAKPPSDINFSSLEMDLFWQVRTSSGAFNSA